MNLKKIRSEDLVFSNEIEDDRTNTYLTLNDYDWMNYNLSTRFRTEEMGVLEVEFEFCGFSTSQMNVKQTLNGKVQEITYEYPTDIFSKNLIRFLEKHIRYWNEKYAFNGEEEVIDFFNEVLDKGTVKDVAEINKNDNRPQCCIDHDKYFSTCDTCEFGE